MEQQHIHVDVRFSIIPEWLLDSEVSDKALRVYAILARYADNETMQAFPSRETIAERARCHVKTVDRALEELINVKAIVKKHRKSGNGYSSNLYTVKRVGTKMSPGRDRGVPTVGTPVSPGRDMDVPLTRTTELEPDELDIVIKRAKPVSADWQPSIEFVNECRGKFPTLNIANEIEAFCDHHVSKGSLFKDINAAFRTWCRNAVKWQTPAQRRAETSSRGPGKREWVRAFHSSGDHWACNPGEFPEGCGG